MHCSHIYLAKRARFAVVLLMFAVTPMLAWVAPAAYAQSLTVETVATGLHQPTFLAAGPGDTERLYVLEKTTGKIILIKNGVVASKPFLDIGSKISTGADEQGLLGFAIHPEYPAKRFAYVNYTDINGDTIIERYRIRTGRDRANQNSVKHVLRIDQPTEIHNGGMLAFGPLDKYLYIATGDGGPSNDTGRNAQDLGTLLGKILRIDINVGRYRDYRIPGSNPFAGTAAARREIWAYGLRNPWRLSFDRLTGDMYLGDVGQGAREEIDFQPASSSGGENYGWRIAEGFACRGGSGTCGTNPGFTPPIHDYDRSVGRCVTGGYVYRGSAIPSLQGTYFFADFIQGKVWSFRYAGGVITEFTERTSELDPLGAATLGMISSMGEDANGELYIVSYGGSVFRIVPAP